ncbi:MAG: glycosyltransferase family 2 protein [Candidatus Muiribacteriota bacterium]
MVVLKKNINYGNLLFLIFLAVVLLLIYVIGRTYYFVMFAQNTFDIIFGTLFLLAELFLLIHGVGYFNEIISVVKKTHSSLGRKREKPDLTENPPVAVCVASFKEPLPLLEETLICLVNLTYSNVNVYLLDDTKYDNSWKNEKERDKYKKDIEELCENLEINLFRRKWRGAKAGIINDFLAYKKGDKNPDFKLLNFSDKKELETEEYIGIFDADMQAFPNFLEPLVQMMFEDEKTAFVQTPQYYTNFEKNKIAKAAGLQQVVFFEYISEGKGEEGAMFCCGTNVLFRREALNDVGGMDESSVTEDFATSLKLHINGWNSKFYNKTGAFGMGPEDMGGYFKQQFRWALGTVGMFWTILLTFLKNPFKLRPRLWWEYFLSSTYYMVGYVVLTLITGPILYIFFNRPSFFATPEIYLLIFTPYIISTLVIFFSTLQTRNYKAKELIIGQFLTIITFPVYIKAVTLALLGIKGSFGVTPKEGSNIISYKKLWVQVLFICINFSAVIWGINKMVFDASVNWSIMISVFWCLYHVFILSFIFYFNTEGEIK